MTGWIGWKRGPVWTCPMCGLDTVSAKVDAGHEDGPVCEVCAVVECGMTEQEAYWAEV